MNNRLRFAASLAFAAALALPAVSHAYHLDKVYHVGGDGPMDYLTLDVRNHLLYVPRGNHTQVVDATDGHLVADIPGQNHNHGVALAPRAHRGFITDSEDACVYVFDTSTYKLLGKVKTNDDADGIIYDRETNRVFVACGDPGQLYAIAADVDPSSGSAEPAIDLGGKPEFLAADNAGHIFVNLADKATVAEVDSHSLKILNKWSTAPGAGNTGLAIDRKNGRLFIGCRKPQKLIVMSTTDGKILGDVPIGAGNDAVQYDPSAGLAFASCRDGTLTIAKADDSGAWSVAEKVKTKLGAKTSALDPTTHTVYLPTADYDTTTKAKRPPMKPGSFQILVVTP